MRNTTLPRTKHSEHHARSFYVFLPSSVERKDGKEWHPSMAMHRGLRKGRWKTLPSWREKVCEDGDELYRDEDASMNFGTFTDFEHAHAYLLLCSVPTALHHSLLCPHALHQPERLRKILKLCALSLSILKVTLPQKWPWGTYLDSWQGRSECLKGEELSGCIAGMCWMSEHQTAPMGCSLASWTS